MKHSMIRVNAFVEEYNSHGFVCWTDQFPGMVASGKTREEARDELILSLRVKFAHDYKLPISKVQHVDQDRSLPAMDPTKKQFEILV